MAIIKSMKTIWTTSDGLEFDTEEEAEKHENVQAIAGELCDTFHWRDASPKDVAVWLLENYEMKRKGSV